VPNPAKEFDKIDSAAINVLNKNIKPSEIVEAETKKRKRSKKPNVTVKDLIAQRVMTMDYLGYNKREAAAMITAELYPEGGGQFTTKQYMHWLNNLKAAKLMASDHYAKEGVVLDMFDLNDTLKMSYQWTLREMRREVLKKEGEGVRKDKGYIIKLGHLLVELAEERQKVLFSVPLVNSYGTVIKRSKGVLDDIKTRYPSIFEVSGTGALSVRVPVSESGDAGSDTEARSESLDESPAREESRTGSSEGNVQSDTDDRSVSQTNRATGTSTSERVFG
jgi:hypothetical protein